MVLMRGILASFSVFNIALIESFRWSRAAHRLHRLGERICSTAPLRRWWAGATTGFGPRILMPVRSPSSSAAACLLSGAELVPLATSTSPTVCSWDSGSDASASSATRPCCPTGSAAGGERPWAPSTMGLGVGILVVPVVQVLITRYGWRTAVALLGIVVLATIVPLNAVFQRRQARGRRTGAGRGFSGSHGRCRGRGERSRGRGGRSHRHDRGTRRRQGPDRRGTGRSRKLSARSRSGPSPWATSGLGTGLALMYTHAVAHLVHVGLAKQVAANAFSLVGVARIPSTAIWGFISDRLGRDRAYRLGTLFTLGGIGVLMALSSEAPAVVVRGLRRPLRHRPQLRQPYLRRHHRRHLRRQERRHYPRVVGGHLSASAWRSDRGSEATRSTWPAHTSTPGSWVSYPSR